MWVHVSCVGVVKSNGVEVPEENYGGDLENGVYGCLLTSSQIMKIYRKIGLQSVENWRG